MMEPHKFQQTWKHMLNDLLLTRNQAQAEYLSRGFASFHEQVEAQQRVQYMERQYDAAIGACLDGQDPILWKLTYSG